MPVKSCCIITKHMDKSHKVEGDYHGQRQTTWFLWKEGIKPSDIHRQLSPICGEKAPAHGTVFNWVQSFNTDKETALAAICEWCHNS
jgi:hypothetical protein